MISLLRIREQIYDHFQASPTCDKYFILTLVNQDAYAAYYTSMYLLQDTTEALIAHRSSGFSANPHSAYLEFWGVMQAIFIQQDAIGELFRVVAGKRLSPDELGAWSELRELRNICTGHPVRKHRDGCKVVPPKRTFMGRSFGNYQTFTYEMWDAATQRISHPKVDLGALIDNYSAEAAAVLGRILATMQQKWP